MNLQSQIPKISIFNIQNIHFRLQFGLKIGILLKKIEIFDLLNKIFKILKIEIAPTYIWQMGQQ